MHQRRLFTRQCGVPETGNFSAVGRKHIGIDLCEGRVCPLIVQFSSNLTGLRDEPDFRRGCTKEPIFVRAISMGAGSGHFLHMRIKLSGLPKAAVQRARRAVSNLERPRSGTFLPFASGAKRPGDFEYLRQGRRKADNRRCTDQRLNCGASQVCGFISGPDFTEALHV